MTTAQRATGRTVAEVMTTGVVSAHQEADLKHIIATITRHRVSTVPVLDARRRVVGVITTADLLARTSGDRGTP